MQVTSSLSQLPPLPPLSPTPTGNSSFSHSQQQYPQTYQSNHLHPVPSSKPHTISTSSSYATLPYTSRPALPTPTSSSSVVVLPDGTVLPTASNERERPHEVGSGRSVQETLAHSSPSSPWSILTVHVLPLFAGGPLRTPIEDLK